MSLQPQIVWHNLAPVEAINDHIRHEVTSLTEVSDRITSCRVAIELPHRHHHHGGHFQVKIELAIPGHVLVADRDPGDQKTQADPMAAVNEAFGHIRRQLTDAVAVTSEKRHGR